MNPSASHTQPVETTAQLGQETRSRTVLSLAARRYLVALFLITPAVAIRLFTSVYPFFQTAYFSLFDYNPAFPPRRFIGLENFVRISKDIVVRESIWFTLMFVLVSTLFQVALGLLIATLLNSQFRLRKVARTINLIPWAIPMVVAAIGFRWMFDDQYGIINDLLYRAFHLKFAWLINFWGARAAVTATNIWKSTPFLAVVFLAGLQGVPPELYEAARVDGANRLQSFWYITIPMVLPLATTMGMFMVVWQLALFDLIYAMTGGGPGFATTVLAYKIFQEAFTALNFGYASAIGMVLFLVVFIVGGIGLLIFRRVEVSM